MGLWYAVTQRDAFQAGFPGAANSVVYAGLLTVGALGLVALVGLWQWRRWAVGLYGVLAVSSLLLDVAAEAPMLHQTTVAVGAVVVFGLVYLNRMWFRRAQVDESG